MLVMNEDFIPYELAVKLKEKGFTCEYPFAMYGKYEQFCPLYSSDKYYFEIDYFVDEHCCIAPTISQVLKWLREEKKLYIEIYMHHNCYLWEIYNTKIYDDVDFDQKSEKYSELEYETYELAAIAGIKYCLENLI